MTTSTGYVMGGTLTEQERLLAQAASYETQARWLLDQLAVQPGWRVADLGCGPIGILDLLAERVGTSGTVVGIDREARFVEMAQNLIAERNLSTVQILQADATSTGLPENSFDLVHERLVLLQQPDPMPLLSEMARIVRPGGWMALEDIDSVSLGCEPSHPAWTQLLEAFNTICREYGMDVYLGRRLPGLLRKVGLADVQAQVHVQLAQPGDYSRTLLLSLVGGVQRGIIDRGLLTESDLLAQMDAVKAHLRNPETVVIGVLFFQAWARKPT
jgi:SAM-dependent methyltransferase